MNDEEMVKKILRNPKLRREMAIESHYWFFYLYFFHYAKYKTANFQREIFKLTENEEIEKTVIVAFRGSAKSTIMAFSYPIWAILGKFKKKFIVIVSQTQAQVKMCLSNIREEFEKNRLLKEDFDLTIKPEDEWRSNTLVISKHQARISALSTRESVRGFRNLQYRPDLIICDDVEDLNSVKTQEGRDNTYRWIHGDLIPMGEQNAKVVVIGNLLHEDSLIMRLRNEIQNNPKKGVFKSYPLINDQGKILWPGKYPNQEAIEREKVKIDNISWKREFLLTIVPESDYVVLPDWIQFYDQLPELTGNDFRFVVTAVDLAISEKASADYTAMVSAYIFGYQEKMKVYILPFPINQKIDFPKTVKSIKQLYVAQRNEGLTSKFFIEEVGYQSALTQQLIKEGISVKGVKIFGDKRSRLCQTTSWIKTGKILFPKQGINNLINQLTGFGIEKHDDLADSFSMLILELMKNKRGKARVWGPESAAYKFFYSRPA